MAKFTFRKADPRDARDLGFEIEEASNRLARAYCRVAIVDWSPRTTIRSSGFVSNLTAPPTSMRPETGTSASFRGAEL